MGGLNQAVWDTVVDVCPDDQHIEAADRSRDDVNPKAVGQAQGFIEQEYRDQAAVDIHGNDPEQRQRTAENELLPADDECQHRVEEHRECRADHGTGDRDLCAGQQVLFVEHGGKVFQCPHTGPDMDAAPEGIRAIVKRHRQGIEHRIEGDDDKEDHNDGIDNGKNFVFGRGLDLFSGCLFCHNDLPPF